MSNFGWIESENAFYVNHLSNSATFWSGKYFDPRGIKVGKRVIPTSHIFLVNGVQCRECLLSNSDDWNSFVDSCYTVGCKDCGIGNEDGWTAINGKKVKFREWMVTENVRENPNEYFKYDDGKFMQDNIILTAYDERKRKRLIIDGLHRCVALTVACEESKPISPARILECHGKNVNCIFPLDIHQLPGNWSFLNFRATWHK